MKGVSVLSFKRKFRKSDKKEPEAPSDGEGMQGHRLAAIKHCKRLLTVLTSEEDVDSINFVIHVLSQGETNKVHRKTSLAREFHRRGTDAAVQEYILKNVVGISHSQEGQQLGAPSEVDEFPDVVADRLMLFQKERASTPIASAVLPVSLKYTLLTFIGTRVDPSLRLRQSTEIEPISDEVFDVAPLLDTPDIHRVLDNLSSWLEFDVFELNYVTQGRPLVHTCIGLLNKYKLFDELPLDYQTVLTTLTAVEACYSDTNPYHNRTHAADVLQSLHALLVESGVIEAFSPLQLFCAFIAAAVHDTDHPGVSNSFMINLESDLAITYNGKSILESHHLATFFRITQHPKCNLFANFTPQQKLKAKSIIVEMVLGTDMMLHADMLDDFKTKIESDELGPEKLPAEYEVPLLRMALHVADVSNPAKRIKLCKEWAARIMEEFFLQGDLERSIKGMPLSKECDRLTASKQRVQIGFIEFIVRPLLESWASLYPSTVHILDQLQETINFWEQDK